MSIGLPTLHGIEAAKQIREATPKSRILFLSQHRSSELIQDALDSGALGYVYKPRAQTELLHAIESVLAGRQLVSGGHEDHGLSRGRNSRSYPAHKAQFYFDDATHLRKDTEFIGSALEQGMAAIIVATELHRDNLFDALKARGVDIAAAAHDGTYIALDAAETLSALMVDEQLDGPRFLDHFGKLIESALKAAKRPRVVIFGEAAALLVAERNIDAAIGLEQLTSDLIKEYNIEMLCGYRFWNPR